MTLSHPTRPARRSRDSGDSVPTAEREAWPEHAIVSTLVSAGIPYMCAWHMSPLDSYRMLAIASADRIPPDEREGGEVMGTKADARVVFGNF